MNDAQIWPPAPEGQSLDATQTVPFDHRAAGRWAALAVGAYAAFNLLLPLVPVSFHSLSRPALAALILGPTCVFMLLQLWLSRALVGLRPRPAVSVAVMAASAALWLLTLTTLHSHGHIWPYLFRQLLLGLFITLACTFFGILLSRIVREANILLPVALIAMPIDYIGAMTPIGFTQNAVAQHPGIVHAVSVPVPTVGGLHPISYIGPGDALFMAFFFAVVLRLGMNDRATFWWMYGLLTIAMLLVLILPNFNIAALIPMGLAVLIANGRAFRLKRAEAFAVLYAGAFVLALVTGFYLFSHAHFFRH